MPYPLWDVTSSGRTEVWPVLPPNNNRVGQAVREENFGMIDIQWAGPGTQIALQICDINGAVKVSQSVPLKSLRA